MVRLEKSLVCALVVLAASGCSDGRDEAPYTPPALDAGVDVGQDARAPEGDAASSDSGATAVDAAPWSGDAATLAQCPVTVRWVPPVGERPRQVKLAGSFNAFAGQAMTGPDANGAFSASLQLAPGAYAYKLVVDGQWRFDDGEGKRVYEGGVENSMLEVADCNRPAVRAVSSSTVLVNGREGRFEAWVRASSAATGVPLASARVVDRHDFDATPVTPASFDAASGWLRLDLRGLALGRHSFDVTVTDLAGRTSEVLHLVTWVEAERFAWQDATIYMAMVDRFADGEASSNAAPTAGVDRRADFQGGDLFGIRDQIRAGVFDRMGVRALWLSPFHRNPQGSYAAANGVTKVTGYHGYWPVKAREVDPRIGGEAGLRALVKEAHAHGIRVLQDFVVNHVHAEHEYMQSHPEWFRTGCVCGTASCDWTARRLDCLFAPYLPDVNWSVPAASKAFVEDASFWLDTFELDGLRVDAVKHVEDAAVRNLTAMVRSRFEAAGTRIFLTGETAMGWSECTAPNCPGNEENYGTINRYMGPQGLDGQFDFVLFHAAAASVFAYEDRGLAHADYWTRASLLAYPSDAVMTPYIGSHDTTRFATMATYRGQAGFPRGDAFRQWDAPAAPAPDAEAFARHRGALAWLLTIPGAPLLYYGDEYGEVGASDPNNRATWRGQGTLSAEETATRTLTEKLGRARMELPALRRGGYRTLVATDDFLAFSRETPSGEAALVLLARTAGPRRVVLPPSLAARFSGTLRDRLGGATYTLASSALDVTLPAHGALVLAP
jgi:neopullulanase